MSCYLYGRLIASGDGAAEAGGNLAIVGLDENRATIAGASDPNFVTKVLTALVGLFPAVALAAYTAVSAPKDKDDPGMIGTDFFGLPTWFFLILSATAVLYLWGRFKRKADRS